MPTYPRASGPTNSTAIEINETSADEEYGITEDIVGDVSGLVSGLDEDSNGDEGEISGENRLNLQIKYILHHKFYVSKYLILTLDVKNKYFVSPKLTCVQNIY